MKHLLHFVSCACFCCMLLSLASCGESAKERMQREAIDSLENANALGRMDYEDLQSYLAIIANGLDSISLEENEIIVGNGDVENGYNRQRMQQQLSHVREILARHRNRIEELEQKLAAGQGDAKHLHTIIVALKQQVAQKDAELAQLRADLDDSRKSVSELKSTVNQMREIQEEQNSKIQEQQEKIQSQADQINNAYVRMASKKQLKKEGLLEGGNLLKRAKVDYSRIDLSLFDVIDTRTTTQISMPRKVKILTPMPEGSYRIDAGTLYITNPELFWSVSNFLIIQTD